MLDNLASYPSFKEIFEELDDKFFISLYLTNPRALYSMCNMLALDLQMEKEIKEDKRIIN